MTLSAHGRAKAVFLEAISRPAAARASYLAKACADDPALQQEVESLLAFHEGPPDEDGPGTEAPTTRAATRTLQHAQLRTTGAGGSLPQHLVTRAARRLQIVCGAAAALVVLLWGAVNIAQGEFRDEFVFASQWAPPVSVLVASLAMLAAARWQIAPQTLVRAGLVYEVVVSLALALSQYAGAFLGVSLQAMNGDRVGLSYVATWTLFFTVLVPARPVEALAALIASNAAVPLVYWSEISMGRAPALGFVAFSSLFIWPYAGVVAASYIAARVVHQLGVEVRRAQDLGAYRLEALLGRGGMGEVWRASHHTLARPAAIKVIRPDALGHDPVHAAAAIARFETEAQVIASLESPHTVQLYDFGTTDEGTVFYVMELLDGIDLDALVRRDGPLQPARVVRVMRQVCASLAEAHHRGLVHRDIKPANLYLCRRALDADVVKVLDFGLATAFSPRGLEGVHDRGGIAGTPDYMAPETVVPGAPVDGRADLYAVGCVAFWLLTGRVVFPRDTVGETIQAHRTTPAPAPSTVARFHVPPELDRLVLGCLEKLPERRPQSALALAAALDALHLADAGQSRVSAV